MHSIFPIIGSTRTDNERCENCTYIFSLKFLSHKNGNQIIFIHAFLHWPVNASTAIQALKGL